MCYQGSAACMAPLQHAAAISDVMFETFLNFILMYKVFGKEIISA